MGSGNQIKAAISKYGKDNFSREILFVFSDETDMDLKEAELVNEQFVKRKDVYNICVGGKGGFSYINNNPQITQKRIDKLREYQDMTTPESRQSIGKKSMETRIKIGNHVTPDNTGKTYSEATRKKMADSASGIKSSQFGTMWITDGINNKKIKKDLDIIPNGWYKGRNTKCPIS